MPKFLAYIIFSCLVAILEIGIAFLLTNALKALAHILGWPPFPFSFWHILSLLLLFTLINYVVKTSEETK